MYRFETFDTVIGSDTFRVSTLNLDGRTAGWVVRRACNVWVAYAPSRSRPEDGVVNLLTDGVPIGQYADEYDAKQALLDDLAIDDEVSEMTPGNVTFFNLDRDTRAPL